MHNILVLTGVDGSRDSERLLFTLFQEMRDKVKKLAKQNELSPSNWQRKDLLPTIVMTRKIALTIARADAIIFLTHTRSPTNLNQFIESVGAYAKKPNKLPGLLVGFIFVGREDPKDIYYMSELSMRVDRMEMSLSPGMLWMQRRSSRKHEQYAIDLVLSMMKKEQNSKMLEPS
ncbi:MAG: hypothetical protein V4436_00115 [Patescibacteria group bacterium]